MKLHRLILPLFLLASPALATVNVVNGPMLGHVSDSTARVWIQLSSAANVEVKVFDQHGDGIAAVSSDVEGPSPFVFDTPLSNLVPNTLYRLEITVDGKKLPDDLTITTAPPAGDAATFSIAFGSGLDTRNDATKLFKAVRLLRPREFLFLGNTGLLPPGDADFPAKHKDAFRLISDFHKTVRATPELQELFHTIPSLATWSDRDFGPANADRDFPHARESLIAFTRFWPNPDAGTPDTPGTFFTSTYADADFFMLDDRTYRHISVPGPSSVPAASAPQAPSTLYGPDQLAWLKDKLKASTARFKIIASGTPCVADDAGAQNAWAAAHEERLAFLQWLFDNKITGVVFISGGAATGQLHELQLPPGQPRNPNAYPLFELTSSTLSADFPPPASQPATSEPTAITDHNFGELEFGGPRTKRFVTLRLHDSTGKVRSEKTLFAATLQVP